MASNHFKVILVHFWYFPSIFYFIHLVTFNYIIERNGNICVKVYYMEVQSNFTKLGMPQLPCLIPKISYFVMPLRFLTPSLRCQTPPPPPTILCHLRPSLRHPLPSLSPDPFPLLPDEPLSPPIDILHLPSTACLPLYWPLAPPAALPSLLPLPLLPATPFTPLSIKYKHKKYENNL